MPSLERAIALREREDLAGSGSHHLHLDMPRALEVTLEVDLGGREVRLCLAGCTRQRIFDLVRLLDDAEPLAPTSGGSLDRER